MFKLLQINVFLFLLIFSSMAFDFFGIPLFLGILGKKETPSKKTPKEAIGRKQSLPLTRIENLKIVWQDEFSYYEDFNENWIVAHDTNKMTCSGILKVSCNSETNVELTDDGYLLLKAYFDEKSGQFTSAAIESKRYFGEGRYEIRAQLPFGNGVRASILTKSPQKVYWHQFGIMSYIQTQILYRTVRTQMGAYDFDDLPVGNFDLNSFHRFGVEWNRTFARFFFDDIYGKLFRVRPGQLEPQQQIRLQISVGGIYFQSSKSFRCDPFEDIFSDCNHRHDNFSPTRQLIKSQFVIDYVRIYQK